MMAISVAIKMSMAPCNKIRPERFWEKWELKTIIYEKFCTDVFIDIKDTKINSEKESYSLKGENSHLNFP